jgi:8-oxo-dGTP diphosphatase
MDPKVGIGVFVFDGAGKFVIGKRKGMPVRAYNTL